MAARTAGAAAGFADVVEGTLDEARDSGGFDDMIAFVGAADEAGVLVAATDPGAADVGGAAGCRSAVHPATATAARAHATTHGTRMIPPARTMYQGRHMW